MLLVPPNLQQRVRHAPAPRHANYEGGDWLTRMDGAVVQAVEEFLGDVLDANQQAQYFFRLPDGGLGLASAAQTAAAAFLGSGALPPAARANAWASRPWL